MSVFRKSSFVCASLISLAVLAALPAVNAQDPTPTTNSELDDVNVQYARKRVELAKTDLEIARAGYHRTPQAFSQLSILRLQSQVAQAEVLLENVLQKETANAHQAHIKCLEQSVELAEGQLDWVTEYSKKFPEVFNQNQVKRFSLNLELAKLALERSQNPKVTTTPMDHLQWQLSQLQSDVLILQLDLERAKAGK